MPKSRIPEPLSTAELKKYRWRERLPELGLGGGKIPIVNRVPIPPATTVPPAQIQMGQTSAPHVFATSPGGGLPTLSQKVWGYAEANMGVAINYLGPVVLAQENVPLNITWTNNLPDKHPFVHPMSDLAAPGSMMSRYSTGRAVVHMHGARVEDGCDGYPMRKTSPPRPLPHPQLTVMRSGQSDAYEYPNEQPGGATLWFHDHAMDMTAKNVYAGLAAGYILRHPNEGACNFLPQVPYEIPLIIQDKSFLRETVKVGSNDCYLIYGDATFLQNRKLAAEADKLSGNRDCSRGNAPFIRCDGSYDVLLPPSPEFKGHAICVNGKLWPTLEVEPRPYRFRIYNGSNSRMYVLRISNQRYEVNQKSNKIVPVKNTADTIGQPALPVYQIGSDGGIFQNVVELSGYLDSKTGKPDSQNFLVLAPGERADVLIDFTHVPRFICSGNRRKRVPNILYLTNHAYTLSPGSTNEAGTLCGNVGDHASAENLMDTLLQFKFKPLNQLKYKVPKPRRGRTYVDEVNNDLSMIQPTVMPSKAGDNPRRFIINEFPLYLSKEDQDIKRSWKAITFETPDPRMPGVYYSGKPGYLWGGVPAPAQNMIAGIPNGGPCFDPNDLPWPIPLGSNETWEIYNLSGDVHPIHLHLVNFKVMSRVALDESVVQQVADSMKVPLPPGAALPIKLDSSLPNALPYIGIDNNEKYWKDTVRANPNEKITLEVFFDANSNKGKNYSGDFVWHCHLIEHEDMGMMRPLKVI